MNEEEKFLIHTLKGSINTYIEGTKVIKVQLTTKQAEILLNLISKLQKELDKSNKRINMCIDLLNLEGCLNFNTKQEKLDYIDKLIKLEEENE